MFRRGEGEERHEPIEPREVRRKEGPGTEMTVVGRGARLEGNVVSAGSLRIEGQVKGKINAEGDVILAPESQVEADVQARNVTVAGRFKGNITVGGKAELAREGRVEGNIRSKVLVVAEGAVFVGQSMMDQVGGQPAGATPKQEAPTATPTAEPSDSAGQAAQKPRPEPDKAPPR